jgi:integrase
MAEGIRKLHSKGCPAKGGGRCRCNAGYEASIFSRREGKRIYKTFARQAEAKSWRVDAKRALDRGTLRPGAGGRTLGEALAAFIEGMRSGAIHPKGRPAYKPNTIRAYERAVRLHIAPSKVATLKVGEVRRQDLKGLAADLLAAGLSAGSVDNALTPIQSYYAWAIDNDEVGFNPSEGIEVPTGHSKRPKRIATAAEAGRLLAALDVADRALWATAFYAGLRRGELQGLRACDIDLGASLVRVERGWDQYEDAIDPKSVAGRRRVPLLAVLRDHLDEHLLRTGSVCEELVFGRSPTMAFYASTADNRAKRAWSAANALEHEAAEEDDREPDLLRPITLHECRHTFASLLIDAGANPKAIQEFMGHSKIQTTYDIYGHLLPGSHDEVRARMDAYLLNAVDSAELAEGRA